MTHHYGKFVWFEHFSNDLTVARWFYDALFGWRSAAVPVEGDGYTMIHNGGLGIGGFRVATRGVPSGWMGYASVEDVDAAAAVAQRAGGRVLGPPTDFGAAGRGAMLADPQGAIFSVWRSTHGDREDLSPPPVGDWYWSELMTVDVDGAVRFYRELLGYDDERLGSPAAGRYHVLARDGVPRAGVMRAPPGAAPRWLPYVRVDDCDTTLALAGALGAHILAEPADVEGVGRFAVFEDPLGALLGLVRT